MAQDEVEGALAEEIGQHLPEHTIHQRMRLPLGGHTTVWLDAKGRPFERKRLEPDILLYEREQLVAMVESEADLEHVPNGAYAARPLDGSGLVSYHPIERMAFIANHFGIDPLSVVLRVSSCWARRHQIAALEPRCHQLGVVILTGKLF